MKWIAVHMETHWVPISTAQAERHEHASIRLHLFSGHAGVVQVCTTWVAGSHEQPDVQSSWGHPKIRRSCILQKMIMTIMIMIMIYMYIILYSLMIYIVEWYIMIMIGSALDQWWSQPGHTWCICEGMHPSSDNSGSTLPSHGRCDLAARGGA